MSGRVHERAAWIGDLAASPAAATDRSWHYLIPLTAVLAVLYAPALGIPPYCDDFMHMAFALEHGLNPFAPGMVFFRPLERFVNGVNFRLLADTTWISVGFSFAGLVVSTGLVFRLARQWWGPGPAVPIVAATLFALHSVNATAVFQVDTISQQYNTVFVLLLLDWLMRRFDGRTAGHYILTFGWMLLAFSSKETSVGQGVACVAAAFLMNAAAPGANLRRASAQAAILLALAVAALVVYGVLHVQFADTLRGPAGGRYAVDVLTLNPVINALRLVGSVGYWGSTLEFFLVDAWWRRGISLLLTGCALGVAVRGVLRVAPGCRRGAHGRRDCLALAVCGLMIMAGMIPACLIQQVSEQYSYLLTPYYSLAIGFLLCRGSGVGYGGGAAGRYGLLLLLAAYAGWMALGIEEKLAAARRAGERGDRYRVQVQQWARDRLPPAGPYRVSLAGEVDATHPYPRAAYSIFSIPNWFHLDWLRYFAAPGDLPVEPEDDRPARVVRIVVAGDRLTITETPAVDESVPPRT